MTEKEFLEIYNDRLKTFVQTKKDSIKNISDSHSQTILDKISDHNAEISEKANLLISELISEFNLDYNAPVRQGIEIVTLSSLLYLKTFKTQLEVRKGFDAFTESILSEALCRDYPNDCLVNQ